MVETWGNAPSKNNSAKICSGCENIIFLLQGVIFNASCILLLMTVFKQGKYFVAAVFSI